MKILLRKFRIIDAAGGFFGSVIVDNGIINEIFNDGGNNFPDADIVVDGSQFEASAVLMPAFIDMHAHFRDPGFPEKETLESASLAAAAGGFGTVVCMANTLPVTDSIDKAAAIKNRSDSLGLIDLYPVLSLTKNMEGLELSGIKDLASKGSSGCTGLPLMLSEDGRDIADDGLFLAAMAEAKRLGVPVSCHCDFGGADAEASKKAGNARAAWSRIEENYAVRRVIELGKKAGCRIHIAHVSTAEAAGMIREEKSKPAANGFSLSCEATPHHFGATEDDALFMGDESCGRVNPPLRSEGDRRALVAAARDGTIDAVATDHAPHSGNDKAAGAPGFTGLETAFAASVTYLADNVTADMQLISRLMSGNPAQILGLNDRGRIAQGMRADLVIADTAAKRKVNPEQWRSRGKCSPFNGKALRGKILMTLNAGKFVFDGRGNV